MVSSKNVSLTRKSSYPLTIDVRVLSEGVATGELLPCPDALSFFGGTDLESGRVTEAGHPLEDMYMAGKILVFPTGKGSTVGSYALYRLAKNGHAPAALVMVNAEPIVTTGAILAGIPCVDGISLSVLEALVGDAGEHSLLGHLDHGRLTIEIRGQGPEIPVGMVPDVEEKE